MKENYRPSSLEVEKHDERRESQESKFLAKDHVMDRSETGSQGLFYS